MIESLFILMIIFCFLFGYIRNNNIFSILFPFDKTEHLLLRETSPDQSTTVSLYEVGSPFLFGSSSIKIYVNSKGDCVFSTSIHNDGKSLNDENYQIVWINNEPFITLDGEEQYPVTYHVTINQ